MVETTRVVETSGERARAGAAGLRISGDVCTVIVTGRISGPHGVPLVGPRGADHISLGGNGDVVAEERHVSSAELLVVQVRWCGPRAWVPTLDSGF